jgi:hypothetical protein
LKLSRDPTRLRGSCPSLGRGSSGKTKAPGAGSCFSAAEKQLPHVARPLAPLDSRPHCGGSGGLVPDTLSAVFAFGFAETRCYRNLSTRFARTPTDGRLTSAQAMTVPTVGEMSTVEESARSRGMNLVTRERRLGVNIHPDAPSDLGSSAMLKFECSVLRPIGGWDDRSSR